jgi:hypothetical protein
MGFGGFASKQVSFYMLRGTIVLCLYTPGSVDAQEIAGYLSLEPRVFFDEPLFPEQPDEGISPSAVASPEFRYEWNDGNDRLVVNPYLRIDADDDKRTHFDLREANWLHIDEPWVVRIGLGRVFWGVAESRHLVDIINQTDLVEDIDQEDKLGQPMMNVERYTGLGTIGLFILPGFRERTFPASDARLSGGVRIANDAVYESGAGRHRTDVALRFEQSLGRWDVGMSGFYGTSREPRLVPGVSAGDGLELVPHYDVIRQLGVDVQYTTGPWLLKLETIRRAGQGRTFNAVVAGFEHTLFSIKKGADLGILAEYLYDGRDTEAPVVSLEDDIFVGLRLALNDVNDTMLLVGSIFDRDDGGSVSLLEAQRRIGDRWLLEAELRWLREAKQPPFASVRNDSFATLRLARYF